MDLGDVNLEPVRVLGEGTFGRVFLCHSTRGNRLQRVCVKRIIVNNMKMEMKMIQEEVYIISQLRHPNIVQFIRSFVHAGTINIVMEYMENGTMRDLINYYHRTGLPKDSVLQLFCDMLMGLEYLHIRHVTHRDIKPENLLLDVNRRIKYADFGISGVHQAPCKQASMALGTPLYTAPEVLKTGKFDFKSDIWSLGCVLYEMCVGYNPFQQARNLSDLRYLIHILTRNNLNCYMISAIHGEVYAKLCERMICYDLKKRISLTEIICIDPLITLPFYRQYFNYNYDEPCIQL